MQAKALVPHSVEVGITMHEETAHPSISLWLFMIQPPLRWITKWSQTLACAAAPHTTPAAASAYNMLVASDVTRHTHGVIG
jgi:hypothetical protein